MSKRLSAKTGEYQDKTTGEFNAFVLLADVCVTLLHAEVTGQFALNYEYQ